MGAGTILEIVANNPIVEIPERVVEVVEVVSRGPQGIQGPQGIPGPPGDGEGGGGGSFLVEAAQTIQGGRAVALDADGRAFHPDRLLASDGDRVVGVSAYSALTGEEFQVVTHGRLEVGTTWDEGPLYVGDNGVLEPTPPTTGWHLQVAVALSATELFVDLKQPIQIT